MKKKKADRKLQLHSHTGNSMITNNRNRKHRFFEKFLHASDSVFRIESVRQRSGLRELADKHKRTCKSAAQSRKILFNCHVQNILNS